MATRLTPTGRNPSQYAPYTPGPRYSGEYAGYVYLPWDDKYVPDQRAQREYLENTGQIDPKPKPPSLMDQAKPLLLATAVPAVANYAGRGALEGMGLLKPAAPTIAERIAIARAQADGIAVPGLTQGPQAQQPGLLGRAYNYTADTLQSGYEGVRGMLGAQPAAPAAAPQPAPAASSAGAGAAAPVTAVGLAEGGGTVLSNGTTIVGETVLEGGEAGYMLSDGSTIAQSSVEGGGAAAGGGGIAGTSIGAQGGVAGYVSAGAHLYQAGREAHNRDNPDDMDRAQQTSKNIGLAVAGYFTGGLVPLIYNVAMRSGWLRGQEEKMMSFDKKMGWLSPNKWLSSSFGDMGFGKSTKAYQMERIRELIDAGVEGAELFYVNKMNEAEAYQEKFGDRIENGVRTDLDKDFVGIDEESGVWVNNAYASTGDMSKLVAKDVWGSDGVFKTFGSDWLGTYTEEQRLAISERLIEEGLFTQDHGNLVIDKENQGRALEIRDSIIIPQEDDDEDEEN